MAHKTYQYCTAENWGKGFIEHNESTKITFRGYPGNVWQDQHTIKMLIFGLVKF